MDIGSRVRAERKSRKLSQEALARRAGVTLNAISQLERGVSNDPHYSTLVGIAEALGVSVGELVEEPVLAGKAEAPPASPSPEGAEAGPAEEKRREHEQDLGVALAILAEDCAKYGRELEGHLKSLDNAAPMSAYPFYEKLFALEVVYEELAQGQRSSEALREAMAYPT